MNTPKLRFKEFIDEWKKIQLDSFVDINPKNDSLPEQFIYIDLESVNNGILTTRKIINKSEAPSRAQRTIKENDILYQTVRPYQMNNLFVKNFDSDYPYIASTGYALLRTKENPYFVYSILYQKSFVNKVLDMCTGTSYPAISANDLGTITVGLPSLKEQEKISKPLELLDKKIELQSKKIEDLKLFKLSIKNNIFKSFDKEQKMSIEKLLEFEQPTKYIVKSEEYTDNRDDIPILTANKAFILGYCKEGNFYNKECIIFDDFTLDMKYVNFAFKVKSSAIKILTPKENINIKYIYEYMQFLNLHSEEHKRHYISTVQKIQIPVPIFEIQNKIATQLNCFDSKIELENNKLLKLIELKKGLMQNMFV